jgi:hypothetical protein
MMMVMMTEKKMMMVMMTEKKMNSREVRRRRRRRKIRVSQEEMRSAVSKHRKLLHKAVRTQLMRLQVLEVADNVVPFHHHHLNHRKYYRQAL